MRVLLCLFAFLISFEPAYACHEYLSPVFRLQYGDRYKNPISIPKVEIKSMEFIKGACPHSYVIDVKLRLGDGSLNEDTDFGVYFIPLSYNSTPFFPKHLMRVLYDEERKTHFLKFLSFKEKMQVRFILVPVNSDGFRGTRSKIYNFTYDGEKSVLVEE